MKPQIKYSVTGEAKTMNLIQVKNTKHIDMYHELETGNVIIELLDDEGTIVNRLTIPSANVFSVIRGLISDRQRFYRKHGK